jgi:putative acetyltransferase
VTVEIRRFVHGDEPKLFEVYYSAIHVIASRDYNQSQIDAWAPADLDQALWRNRMRAINPFVALLDDEIVGYADIQPSGYIDHFFVSGYYPRQGIGSQLMSTLHQHAAAWRLTRLTSDVSRSAQPLFEKHGFLVVEERRPEIRGVVVPNALMQKLLQ